MPTIEAYSFGSMRVDGQTYSHDVVVLPSGEVADWWRETGHALVPGDLSAHVASDIRVIVIGTGAYGIMRVTSAFEDFCAERKIELVAAKTAKAVEEYNNCVEPRRIGAFHLTC